MYVSHRHSNHGDFFRQVWDSPRKVDGKVKRYSCHLIMRFFPTTPLLDASDQDFRHTSSRLYRRAADVRCHKDVIHFEVPRIDRRLAVKHVQTRGTHVTGIQRRDQRVVVDEVAPRNVDDDAAWWQALGG